MKYLKILLVYLILFPSLVKGDYLDSLLLIYDDMDSKLNIEVANAVMLWLNEQQLSDSVIIFNDEHTKDYIDAQLFAPLSTYFYAQNRYAEAILYSDRGIQAASKISEDDLAAWCYST